jgi:hypothetical protein
MTIRLEPIISALARELLQPLVGLSGAEALQDLFEAAGWDAAALGITEPGPFAQVVQHVADALDALDASSEMDDIGIVNLADGLASLAAAIVELTDLISSLHLPHGGPAGMLATLGENVGGFLVDNYLASRHPKVALVLEFLGIVAVVDIPEIKDGGGTVVRAATQRRRLNSGALSQAITDPLAYIRQCYLTDGAGKQRLADEMSDLIGPELAFGFRQLGLTAGYGYVSNSLTPEEVESAKHILVMEAPIRTGDDGPPKSLRFAMAASDTAGGLGGLVVVSSDVSVDIATAAGRITGGISGALEPLIFTNGSISFASTGMTGPVQLDAGLAFKSNVAAAPALRFGSTGGTGFEIGEVQASLGFSSDAQHVGVAGSVDLKDAVLAIQGGDGDGFLGNVLPADGLAAKFDLGLAWSTQRGLTFRGAGGLNVTVPVSASVGGAVTVPSVHLDLRADDAGLIAEVSASIGVSIGPVQALVDKVGITGGVTFPKNGGNLGVANLAVGFKPPSGIGLSVDAQGVVTGGGFLYHDAAQGLYAGAMQLSLNERITLKAFGLIATRLPDGSPGYSLIVFITAEDFQPIPLDLGFMLLGIGGMVGVNRTFDEEVLRQGLKNGTLATLLFPRDPVVNASALIRALSSAFPARRGSYLLGLLAKIGWPTPTLVLMDLALILEFGARNRLLALGHISALLPSASNDLVRLNMEAMGVLDFDAGTAAIDAVLLDSRLAHKFAITGAAALRAGFASGPSFVLAVGGLNPHFAPPAGFPTLERVAIALSSGDNPRLLCQAYFAITSNTVQFGAAASLYARAAGFSVQGDVGFDVLVQLLPLHFIADYHAKLQLKYGSHNLFMVSLDGELEGPRPLRISGKATFEIFWCDFSVHFDTTLVRGEPPPLPAAVDVLARLLQALAQPASWHIERSLDHPHGVALRSLAPSGTLVLDPLGRLSITQQTVPLNTGRDVDTFGGAPVAGARRFALTASLNGTTLTGTAQQAAFAPAQYFTMSDDEKLAAPAFESMDAGYTFGSAATQLDATQSVAAPLTYRTIVIGETPAPTDYVLNGAQLRGLSRSGAAARAPQRRVGRARFANTAAAPAASLLAPRWSIAPKGDGAPRAPDPALRTWSDYHAALTRLNRADAIWQLLPSHELEP